MAEPSTNGQQEPNTNTSSNWESNSNDFSNLQVLTNQLDQVAVRSGGGGGQQLRTDADADYESGDENNESVEDNNEPSSPDNDGQSRRRCHGSTQMNISNDEYCCSTQQVTEDGQCQSVIYSNFDGQEEDSDTQFKTNMEKLNENPNLVLTVDDDEDGGGGGELNCDEDLTINTVANLTKISDSTNQQDEQDYIDEDFAPNQLNACSSDDECGRDGVANGNLDAGDGGDGNEDEIEERNNDVSKSSSNTDNANVNDFADEASCSKASQSEFKVNDLTTVNDFNAESTQPVNSDAADHPAGKVLFQDSEDFEAPDSGSLPDFGRLKLAESDKSFIKNIDGQRNRDGAQRAASSLKFESVSSIEDNSNDLPSSSAYSSKSQTISECQVCTSDSASSASLATAENEQFPFQSSSQTAYNEGGASENEAHIWTETEALLLQHEQTSPSACGASAIVNVLVSVVI